MVRNILSYSGLALFLAFVAQPAFQHLLIQKGYTGGLRKEYFYQKILL